MRIKVNKRYIVLISCLFFIAMGVITFFSVSHFLRANNICKIGTNKNPCGLEQKSPDGSQYVAGYIVKKHSTDKKFFFTFTTLDKNKHPLDITLTLPDLRTQDNKPVKYTLVSRDLGRSDSYIADEFYKKVSLNKLSSTNIVVLDQSQISLVKKNTKDTKFINCFEYHSAVLKYLNNPTLTNKITMLIPKLFKGCSVSITSLIIWGI